MRALSRIPWIALFAIPFLFCLTAARPASAAESDVRATAGSAIKRAPATTIDDLLLQVADRVPSFGGMYLDANGRLSVYLTDTTQLARAQTAISAVFGKGRVDVSTARAVRARYTFPHLKTWHDQHRLNTLAIRGVVLTAIHKTTNRLQVGVENADVAAAVGSVLARYSIPSEAVEIVVMEPIRHWDKITDTHRPLVGGLFESTASISGCTLGFLAVRGGQAGFVTCSHCTDVQGSVEGTVFHQATVDGTKNRIGFEIADPPYTSSPSDCPSGRLCRFSDAAFIARDGGPDRTTPRASSHFGRIALPDSAKNIVGEFELVGEASMPIDGEIVAKVGQNSGFSGAVVSLTCTDMNDNGTNFTNLCQNLAQETDGPPGGPGDSGSVVFNESGTPESDLPAATLYGLLWGGNSTSWAFSSMSFLDIELGTLRTSMVAIGVNSPPEVKIRQPQDFAGVGVGGLNFVAFQADVVDYEGCCQSITWSSDKDGVMGHGANLDFTFQTTGARTVTVTATDDDGGVGSDSVEVIAGTTPPSVTIVKPTAGQTLFAGIVNVFSGSSFDPNEPFLAIPCMSLTWTSSKAGDPFPATGCNPQVTFQTLGTRTLTLSGTDSYNLTANASVSVNVVNAPAGPPIVTVLNPFDDAYLPASNVVPLTGKVQDPGNQSPIAYRWLLIDGSTVTVLSTGSVANGGQPTFQWKPSDNVGFSCGGRYVTLELEATNPGNQTGTASVTVKVAYPTC